ncbi:MAG: DUF3465 domain-containing protein [Acidobacteria bacterium]|nr:DUF3465 domain-containing protein [Acidobacteriota bacterium]MCA1609556.1 DUF3465 domain-containing protein [Acidobacteriota bacterium]
MRARRWIGILLAGILAVPAVGSARRRPQHGNPHEEVTAMARVETAPRRTRHRNGRSFEELDVLLLSVQSAEPRRESGIPFETRRPVHVVHDLTCGGTWVDLAPGDRVELKGEYVHTPSGRDVVHFTHPADSSCGRGTHPGGFLRREGPRAAAAAGLPAETASDQAAAAPPAAAAVIPPASVALFQSTVRPVLAARCTPCHEPGGKMYGRMPFDNASVVALHAARMAGRLSGPDRKTIEEWAAGVAAAPAH